MYFEVHSTGSIDVLIPLVRRVVREVDPGLPLMNVKMQTEQVEEALSEERMSAYLSVSFCGLALPRGQRAAGGMERV
jgi:hypothetical protein